MPTINWVLDRHDLPAIDTFLERMRRSAFESESLRRKLVHQLNVERRRRWSKPHDCSFLGCPRRSIVASHSLSRSMMLKPIASDRHVYGPEVDTFEGRYFVQRVSVNEASVFPGFCEEHENAFTFEAGGQIVDLKDYQMQLFRSVCRHRFFIQHERDSLIRYIDEMDKLFHDRFARFLKGVDLKGDVTTVRAYCHEELLGMLGLMRHQRTLDIEHTESVWYRPLGGMFGRPLGEGFSEALVECDEILPIVVSGPVLSFDCPRDDSGTPDFDYTTYVNLFPNGDRTVVHLAASSTREDDLRVLIEQFSDPGTRDDVIKRWIVESSDHWYMSPNHWDGLGPRLQEELCSQLGKVIPGSA